MNAPKEAQTKWARLLGECVSGVMHSYAIVGQESKKGDTLLSRVRTIEYRVPDIFL